MKKFFLSLVAASAMSLFLRAAAPPDNPPPDARYKVDLLVVVAHPDDETAVGAYLARAIFDEKKRVAVVFGTRGNGGGNAEGQEQAAALGAIREIEARRALAHFDISEVWFLNGLDTPGQVVLDSLETWNHGDALGRMVRLIRLTRPAVVASWLPDWVAGENHGDHQAAGVIATEAFDLAGNPTSFPEQLATPRNREDISNLTEGLSAWQAQKIYYFTDAAHTEFLEGKGPRYSAAEMSPSRHEPYARLAAEECSYHLTQGDTGQMAREALRKNNLQAFDEPVRFIFGKSYVPASKTGDLFEGTSANALPYHPPPGFKIGAQEAAVVTLGGSWNFYRQFWQAHGLENLSNLVGPEIMAQFSSRFTIPVLIQNSTDAALPVHLAITLPDGWSFVRRPDAAFSVPAHSDCSYVFEMKTASAQSGWQTIDIAADSNGVKLGEIRIRAELNGAAMPE